MRRLKLALLQLRVGPDKQTNINGAIEKIKIAAHNDAKIVCLPECFNSPFGVHYFSKYAEDVRNGVTNTSIQRAAHEHKVWLLGGSIPERATDGTLYNTHTTFSPLGEVVGHYRKMHMFDVDIPGKITFKESSVLRPGNSLLHFNIPINTLESLTVGVGICYDIRFAELALIYSQRRKCQFLFYPGAFNTTTGPIHWKQLAVARALDNQCYVAMCSPARNSESTYQAYGHSMVVDPWGNVLVEGDDKEEVLYADIDLDVVDELRKSIPISFQRRSDVYAVTEMAVA